MHIFLDSNVLYSDPFFKSNYSRILLELCRQTGATIYISEVVRLEVLNNYLKLLEDRLRAASKHVDALNRILQNMPPLEYEQTDKYVAELEAFFDTLESEGVLEILPIPADLTPALVDRWNQQKKPFSQGKDSWRDAIIWLSYAMTAEAHDLTNCVFISDNTSDFFADDKKRLHEDLLVDSQRFRAYINLKGILHDEQEWMETHNFNTATHMWLLDAVLDERYVESVLNRKEFWDVIYSRVSMDTSDWDADNIDWFVTDEGNDLYLADMAETYAIDIHSVQDVQITQVVNSEIIISGTMKVINYCELYAYNSWRDPGDDLHIDLGSHEFNTEIPFSFVITVEDQVGIEDNLELE